MKQLYRVLPVVLSVGLFGCDNSSETTTPVSTDAVSTDAVSTDAVITDTQEKFVSALPSSAPVVKLSADANYAPYGFKDEYGNITGFDIDLVRHIGEDQGFKVEVYGDLWKDAFNNIDNKSRDMIAAGASYSAARSSKYLTSDPYLPLPSTIVYLDSTLNIQSLNGLSDVSVGVLDSAVQYDYFTQGDFAVKSVEAYPTIFMAIQAMAQGKIDAVAADTGVLRYTLANSPTLQPKYFEYEGLGADNARKVMYVSKEHPELLTKINLGLEKSKADGTYATLTQKWFGYNLTEAAAEQQKILKDVKP